MAAEWQRNERSESRSQFSKESSFRATVLSNPAEWFAAEWFAVTSPSGCDLPQQSHDDDERRHVQEHEHGRRNPERAPRPDE
jgi:hypothetical protein